MGNLQGTQEHDLVTRATAAVLGERDEKKRPGLELGWKREGGDSVAAFLPHPGVTSRPWVLPPFTLVPQDSTSCPASGPSGSFFCHFFGFFFFGILRCSFFGFLWYSCFLFGLTYFPLTDSDLT